LPVLLMVWRPKCWIERGSYTVKLAILNLKEYRMQSLLFMCTVMSN
jgi:hypothetical protein